MAPAESIKRREPSRSVELRTWFIEPVFDSDHNLSTGLVRVWGKVRASRHPTKWWRSSSIHQRVSFKKLKTRYGTCVNLKGGISKRYARKLQMHADAIQCFRDGFPATWRKLLGQSFTPEILLKSNERTNIRRSSRPRNRPTNNAGEQERSPAEEKNPKPAAQKKVRRSSRRASQMVRPRVKDQQEQTWKASPAIRERPRSAKAKMSYVEAEGAIAEGTLARNLRGAKDAKQARRARRVAFADSPMKATGPAASMPQEADGATGGKKPTTRVKGSPKPRWSAAQREEFDRQRNSVAADASNYWEVIASGVRGKTGEECRLLWESSWASPQASGRKREGAGLSKRPEEMVLEMQKAAKSKRGRNTAKFRRQARELAELVSAGTLDTVLEPCVPGAAAASDVVVTPRLQGIGVACKGTPGTEVRQLRERNEKAATATTPEILSRGRKIGLAEADQYVSLFKRRAGKGGEKAYGGELDEGSGKGGEADEEVRELPAVEDDKSYSSDDSDDSCPFF